MVNKDFLKQVLAGEKQLLPKAEVTHVEVPHYDELSVKALYPMFKKDAEFMSYFPDKYPVGKGPPRAYFFNVLATKHPDYLAQVMEHANKQRMSSMGSAMQTETIAMTPFWQEQLASMPYMTRKWLSLYVLTTFLFPMQARTARRSTCSRPAASRSPRTASVERSSSWAPSASTRSPRRSRCPRTTRSAPSLLRAHPLDHHPFCSSWLQGHKPPGRPTRARTTR